ncbi:MAG: hypothetical protein LC099_04455 [Anaerolineales bacterium]|nr:hypothetical protein [Anaerolineales bacterium]
MSENPFDFDEEASAAEEDRSFTIFAIWVFLFAALGCCLAASTVLLLWI